MDAISLLSGLHKEMKSIPSYTLINGLHPTAWESTEDAKECRWSPFALEDDFTDVPSELTYSL